MKKLILISSVILTFSNHAFATQILSYYPHQTKDGKITSRIFIGFMEDGFSRAPNTCYLGSVQGVCDLIHKTQREVDEKYSAGNHGTFTILNCRTEGSVVKLNYDRVSDYPQDTDDKNIKLDIKACSDQ